MKPGFAILTGLLLALGGSAATTFYILALSHLYVGRWTAALAEGVAATVLFVLFFRCIHPYLDRLMHRFPDSDQHTTHDE